jgi:ribosomal protein S18 acetylase RimI-like enzyme
VTHATAEVLPGHTRLRPARLDEPAARPLLEGLAEYYAGVYGDDVARDELATRDAADFRPPAGTLLLLESGGKTIAGGGLVRIADGLGEIKRMWTSPNHRCQGHARRVLAALEAVALERGYTTVRLQTGDLLDAALALYRATGYRQIPTFGPYLDEPRARAFEKRLDVAQRGGP